MVPDLLDGHVSLDVERLDRIYLNGYVPNLQVGGQASSFLREHLGYPIPSPVDHGAGDRHGVSAGGVALCPERAHILVKFSKKDRKIEVMRRHLAAQEGNGRSGVAAVGVAQELQNVFAATVRERPGAAPWFSFYKADRRVTCFYFYLWDEDFSGRRLSRCAPTSRTRSRCGSTATSGPNASASRPGSIHRPVQRVRQL